MREAGVVKMLESTIEALVREIDSTLAYESVLGHGFYANVVKVKKDNDYFALKISKDKQLVQEFGIQKSLKGIRGIPEAMRLYGDRAFLMELVDGSSLSETHSVSKDFFDKLKCLAYRINDRGYFIPVDLHECNVLVGSDGDPWMVDFYMAEFYGLPASGLVFDMSDLLIEGLMRRCRGKCLYV